MTREDVLEVLAVPAWDASVGAGQSARAVAALEEGRVLFFPFLQFILSEGEKKFLTADALEPGRKNISRDPETGACQGSRYKGEAASELAAMLRRFAGQAEALVLALAPGYAGRLERARTSFRPAEIEDRATSMRKDDRLLHVDAFPTRPTGGKRILRVFSNIAPDGAQRLWRIGEPFPEFAKKFFPGMGDGSPRGAWFFERLGLTKGRRSAYDSIMLRLHDRMKEDRAYQTGAPAAEVAFPPGTTWIVYTDQVLHAALAGRFALEQTFHLPVAAMSDAARAPISVLERLAGRALA